jgi:hypothetical protein
MELSEAFAQEKFAHKKGGMAKIVDVLDVVSVSLLVN